MPSFVGERTAAPARTWAPVALVVALIALSNVMTNRVLPGALYVPWNLGMAFVLLMVARGVDDLSADEVGRLARAFNTMAVDLATADEQRRHLVATVSHELRTPLAGQRLLLENLVDGVVQPGDDSLATALAQAERLSDLVANLLDLARIDGGAAPLDLAPVAVGELVDRAVAEAELDARPVSYDVVVTPEGLTVMADGARLTQVVANLLDNAARHATSTVTLTLHEADGRARLVVADDGDGIPNDQREQVFERFVRLDDARTRDSGGAGLGLAIAREIAERHGGTLRLADGLPTRFVLEVPARPYPVVTRSQDPVRRGRG